tara:strand:+ start:11575 stop:12780 length:1206 start_codon:yes stop_codon:yes gene_type:complete
MNIKIDKLDNGIPIIYSNTSNELFTCIININVGSYNETNKNNGISHVLEHMLFNSTQNIDNPTKILDKYGIIYNAYTNQTETCYYMKCLPKYYKIVLLLLSEMLFQPIFDKCLLENEKEVVLHEIHNDLDDDNQVVLENLIKILFKNDSFRFPIGGNKSTIKNMTIDDLTKYHETHYNKNNITFFVDSNNIKNLHRDINKFFMPHISNGVKNVITHKKYKINIIKTCKINAKRCYLYYGYYLNIFNKNIDDYIILLFLDSFLINGLNSYLFKLLRLKGLVYNIDSIQEIYGENILYSINLLTDYNNIIKILDILNSHMLNLENKIFKNEIESNINKIITKFKENEPDEFFYLIIKLYNTTNKIYTKDDIIDKISKISSKKINNWITKHLTKKNLFIFYNTK